MKILGIIAALTISLFSLLLIIEQLQYNQEVTRLEGFLHTSIDHRQFYVEDIESGRFTALQFAFDDFEELE